MFNPSDYSIISFPSLGLAVNPPRTLQLLGLNIHLYGMIIAFGMLLAVIYAMRRTKQFGLTEDHLLDGVIYITPFAILCARLYYCAFQWQNYADNPISILYIWEGGLAIYGGVIGAVLGVIVYCKIKKISIGAVLDVLMLGFMIGQSIGRWGNFCNREAFGDPVSQDFFLAMGLFNERTQVFQYFHPTFLYESVWNAVGFVILHFLSKKRQYDGQIALGYMAWYGLGRAWIEGLRTDSLYWGPFRVSQVLAAASCLIALVILVIRAIRKQDEQKLFVNRVAAAQAAEAEEAAQADCAVSDDTI